ncbi:uncharacterized protein BP5553_08750 [Venustampulla echinocandica]|uniref:Nephrocystin 3-like N-terminal domain-containing protein n=1 Tax=Venustampulla echinocandica TaxID=2656787 RepID=A0A370TF58_9HELO|nr:uncharacterized protein BP5553_08750 [Venustampulla echinocandica]RDL33311.1 hypothetical protein BP5553_08750 [Venustampulla echinocandica]
MDPLSIIASSAAIFDALKSAYRFAEDFIKAGEEREDFKSQLNCVADLEWALNQCIEKGKSDPDASWLQPLDPVNASSPLAGLERTMAKMVKTLKMKESTFKQRLKDFKWHSEKKAMEEFFRAIQGYCQAINVRLSIGNIILSRSQMALMRETHEMTKNMAANGERQRKEEQARREEVERKDIERWLSPLDFQARQREIFEMATRSSSWFLDLPEFKCWKEDSLAVLRCYGDTGTGKTVLSSIVVNYLTCEFSAISPTLCIYFEKTPSIAHTPKKILGSLLKQLIQLKGPSEISPDVYQAWKKATGLNAQPTQNELMELFKAEVQFYSRIYVVVDALDEAPIECRDFIERQLRRLSSDRLRLLTTARGDEERSAYEIHCDICKQKATLYYRCVSCPQETRIDMCAGCRGKDESCTVDPTHEFALPNTLEVDIIADKDDLELYVKSKIKEQMPPEEDVDDLDMNSSRRISTKFGRHCHDDTSLFSMIVSSIVDNSMGKFLLAKLYTNSLSNKVTKGDIKRAAREMENRQYSLSDTINRLYEADLKDRIESQEPLSHRKLALKILSLVYYAQRNLRLRELQHALATRHGETEYDPDDEMDEQEILRFTKGFITIGRDKDSVVRLDDRTLYEYFDQTRGYWFPQGEVEFAKICLSYFGFDTFSKSCSTELFAIKEQKHALLAYTVEHWGDHVRNAGIEVKMAAVEFLQDKSRIQAYVQAAWETDTHEQYKWDVRRDIHALHICAWFNLEALLSALDSKPLDIDVQEETYGQTPLMYACRRGNIEIARRLLVLGASVNMTSERGRTALFEAVLQKNDEMVDLLLDFDLRGQDVDVNARNTKLFNRTPLITAIRQSSDEVAYEHSLSIAHALLKHPNISVNLEDSIGYTALSLAAYYDLESVVNKLLSFSNIAIDVTEKEGGRSALILAAERNHVNVLTSLLDGGADPNLKDTRGGTAILRAAEEGHMEALQILIDLKADLTFTDEDSRTVVHVASEGGHIDVLELLKDHPVEVNARDKYGLTPFHRACHAGQLEAGRYLLELGADSAIQDSFQRTPFVVAWQYGQTDLMDLCRDVGTSTEADTAQIIKSEKLPIWSLVCLHRLDLLTEAKSSREADFCTREPGTGSTALHCAIVSNDDRTACIILDLLLSSPAQPLLDALDKFKQTPLHLAAIHEHIECTKLLLSHEPLLDEVSRFGYTPLTIAYINQRFDIAVALVEAGATISPESSVDIQIMLFAAIELQNIGAVENLMKAGADRIAQDEYGRTADMLAKRIGNGEILRVLQPYRSFMFKIKVKEQKQTVLDTVSIVESETYGDDHAEEGEMKISLKEISFKPFRTRHVELET